jgi:leucyl-tRNA synthetase
MLSCIIPHVGEEMWQILGHENTIAYEAWPTYDEEKCKDDMIEIVAQINGKLRAKLVVPADIQKDEVLALAKADEKVAAAIAGKTIVKEIVVPGKLVNIVVKG